MASISFSSVLMYLYAITLSAAWLIPNHYQPWTAFHSDAWIAFNFLFIFFSVVVNIKNIEWNKLTILVAVMVFYPFAQFIFGLVDSGGKALISSVYIFGFLLTLILGQIWEKIEKNKGLFLIFSAVSVAAVASVNLQLHTWLNLIDTGIFDIWSMGLSGARPYANIGQPNQLGTLLIWGLLGCGWAFVNLKIRGSIAALMACFLLVGIALTQSRTAWLGLSFLLAASWYWKRLWPSKRTPWVVTALFIFFWTCPSLLRALADALLLGNESSYLRGQLQGDLRLAAWRLFLSAAMERPWFGYGWTEVGHAQLAVASQFPPLYATFGHSHNLFLDLVLWLGFPLGLAVSGALVWWFVNCFRVVANAQDAILVMFLAVIGIHAMLELPLHYAYFLLPTGMVMGVLNQRLGVKPIFTTPRWTLIGLWLVAALMLAGIIRDYFRIESSFQAARFEMARIGTLPVGEPPDVLLLTQLRERITYMRYEVKSGMTPEELDWVDKVVNAYPGGGMAYKAAKAFALNNRPAEAQEWLKKICKISSPEECDLIKRVWTQDAVSNPLIAAIPWPE